MVLLEIAPCTYDASKYAVTHWHYSKQMPTDKKICLGVYENKKFIGTVIFNRGSRDLYKQYTPYNRGGVCELTRIALKEHQTPVTKIIKEAIKIVKKTQPQIEVIISYADINQHHLGIIYQAGNWIYEGKVAPNSYMIIHGIKVHRRSASKKYGTYAIDWIKKNVDPDAYKPVDKGRHKYSYPLNKKQRQILEKRKKPYPKY